MKTHTSADASTLANSPIARTAIAVSIPRSCAGKTAIIAPAAARVKSTAPEILTAGRRPEAARRAEPPAERLRTTVAAWWRAEAVAAAAVTHHAPIWWAEPTMSESVRTAPAVMRRAEMSPAAHHAARATRAEAVRTSMRRSGESAGAEFAPTTAIARVPPVGSRAGRLSPVSAAIRAVIAASTGRRSTIRRACTAAGIAVLGASPGDDGIGRAGAAQDLDELLPQLPCV